MRTVSAREANQQFSRLLEHAVGGEEVTITRRGVPVAKLVPVRSVDAAAEAERRKAAALEWLESGALTGGVVADWTRDELYDERFEHPWRRTE